MASLSQHATTRLSDRAGGDDPDGSCADVGPPAFEPVPGQRVGRYLVMQPVGRGGMGSVFRAYDPKLGREVALKFVTECPPSAAATPRALVRIAREAQAMAKLSHPNVVAVFDVEDIVRAPGQARVVFIVMEFVDGMTLRTWRRQQRRSVPEILEAFVQAGRGLAAAHAAGLVHRDFKPANVLVGKDGRIRVTDFGLVRPDAAVATADSNDPDHSRSANDTHEGSERLTQAGTVMGTPGYMAPEQHEGAMVDARADIYAFCVALYEALHGRRPYVASSLGALVRSKLAGPPHELGLHGVPVWLDRIVARGLRVKPSERFASMDELLSSLQRSDPRRRRRTALAGLAVVVAVTGAYGNRAFEAATVSAGCDRAAAALSEDWNDERAERLHDHFASDGRRFAPKVAGRVAEELDRYVAEWSDARRTVCRQAAADEASDFAAVRACLEARRSSAATLVSTLSTVNRDALPGALDAVLGLPSVGECTEPSTIAAFADAPDLDRRVEVRARLAAVWALRAAGRLDAAMKAVQSELAVVGPDAERSDDPLLWAEAMMQRAEIHDDRGDARAAATDMREVYWAAAHVRADRLAARAAIGLVSLEGATLGDVDRGRDWVRDARMSLARSGSGSELLNAKLTSVRAAFEASTYQETRAVALGQEALAAFEAHLGPEHPTVAAELGAQGERLSILGRDAEATAALRRALSIQQAAYGPAHPRVGSTLARLAEGRFAAGDLDGASAYAERAAQIKVAAHGADHPAAAKARALLGAIASQRGEHRLALEHFEAVQRIYRLAHGPSSASVGGAHNNLAVAFKNLGRTSEAIEHFEQAVAIAESIAGSDSAGIIAPLINLARLYRVQGQSARSLSSSRRAQALALAHYGPNHRAYAQGCLVEGWALSSLGDRSAALAAIAESIDRYRSAEGPASDGAAYGLVEAGEILLAQGKADAARRVFAEAVALWRWRPDDDTQRAYAEFGLARSAAELGGSTADLTAAIAMARRAHAALGRGTPTERADAASVGQWLAERAVEVPVGRTLL